MSNSFAAPIDKLMLWQANSWKKFDSNDLILRIHCDQLLITSEVNIIESLNMKEKIRGIFKEDVLILYITNITKTGQEIRKIKFRIKCNARHCFEELNKYFSVIGHDSKQTKNLINPQFLNVEEVITHALSNKNENDSIGVNLPPSFKNFVRLCLLDPLFPELVEEIQNILQN